MAQIRKENRNKKIVELREMKGVDNQPLYSFPEIARRVKLKHHSQVIKIYKRDKELYKGDK